MWIYIVELTGNKQVIDVRSDVTRLQLYYLTENTMDISRRNTAIVFRGKDGSINDDYPMASYGLNPLDTVHRVYRLARNAPINPPQRHFQHPFNT